MRMPVSVKCDFDFAFPRAPHSFIAESSSDRLGAVKGARVSRRSEPLTARTDLLQLRGKERGRLKPSLFAFDPTLSTSNNPAKP